MRYLMVLSVCSLTLMIFGCSDTEQPAAPSADGSASSGDDAPASQDAMETGDDPTLPQSNENNGRFDLDIDVGDDGVRVETEGPDNESGLEVDVDPGGQVDIDVDEKSPGEGGGSSP